MMLNKLLALMLPLHRSTASVFATYAYTTLMLLNRVYATSDGAAAGQAGSLTVREVTDGRALRLICGASPGTSSATEAPAAGSIGGAFFGSYARYTTGSTTRYKTRLWVNKAPFPHYSKG
jgi:hypothetical protein